MHFYQVCSDVKAASLCTCHLQELDSQILESESDLSVKKPGRPQASPRCS